MLHPRSFPVVFPAIRLVYDIMNGTELSIGEQSARRIGNDETLLDYGIESECGGHGTTLDGKKKKKKKRKKMVAPTPKQA